MYRARQLSLNREVALKLLNSHRFDDDARRRFRQEAEIVAQLDHPNIVQVYERGEDQDVLFIAMTCVEGLDLEKLATETPLTPRQAADYVSKVADAVAYLHANNVLHRDLKPSNILIDQRNEPRVTDFGLAKRLDLENDWTASSVSPGSLAYMAPEQLSRDRAQPAPASDIYSLGATLYRLLTGGPPLPMTGSLLRQIFADEVPVPSRANPRVSRDLDTLCSKCLDSDPSKRFGSAADLAAELRRFLNNDPILTRPRSPLEKLGRWTKRNPLVTALFVTLALLIIGSGLFGNRLWGRIGDLHERGETLSKQLKQSTQAERDQQARADREQREHLAEQSRRRHQTYIADMRSISDLWRDKRLPDIHKLLRKYETPGLSELRGFEWYYWSRRTSSTIMAASTHSAITSIAWSPLGDRLFVTDARGCLTSLTVKDGIAEELLGPESKSLFVVVSSDPEQLAVASFGESDEFNAERLNLLHANGDRWRSRTVGMPVTSAVFSRDGKLLATGHFNGDIVVWDVETLKGQAHMQRNQFAHPIPSSRHNRNAFAGHILGLAFSDDSKIIASASSDGACRLWSVNKEEFVAMIERDFPGSIAAVSFSLDQQQLVLRGMPEPASLQGLQSSPGEVSIWSLREMWRPKNVCKIVLPEEHRITWNGRRGQSWDWPCARADFAAGDSVVFAGVGRFVRFWKASSGTTISDFAEHESDVVSVRLSPNGSLIASGDVRGDIKVWKTQDRFETSVAHFSHPIGACGYSEINDRIVVTPNWGATHPNGSPRTKGDTQAVGRDGVTKTFPAKGWGFALDPRSNSIVTSRNGFTLWDCVSGEARKKLDGVGPPINSELSTRLAFGPDGEIYFLTDRGLESVDPKSGERQLRLEIRTGGSWLSPSKLTNADFTSVALSPDGKWVVFGTHGGAIRIFDARTWKQVEERQAHPLSINALAFSPDSTRLAVGSGRYYFARPLLATETPGTVTIYDSRTWQHVLSIESENPREFYGLLFCKNGRELIASCNSSSIQSQGEQGLLFGNGQIWDPRTKQFAKVQPHDVIRDGSLPTGEIICWATTR